MNCLMAYGTAVAMERLTSDLQSQKKDQVIPYMSRASLTSFQVMRTEETTTSSCIFQCQQMTRNFPILAFSWKRKKMVLEIVPCDVQITKKQSNYLGQRQQTSAMLCLQASTNCSEVLPQNRYTFTHLGPMTDSIVLMIQ